MPDPPVDSKRKPQRAADAGRGRCSRYYAELHCKTNFSFLEGASHPDELVVQAAKLEYSALAITDRNSLAGVVRAHAAAKDSGFKLLIGAEITPADAPAVVLLATDRAAYRRLCRLITLGRGRAPKGECDLAIDDIASHSDGLLAGILPPVDGKEAERSIAGYRDIFADRCYLFTELHYGTDDARRLANLLHLSKQSRVPLAAAGDVHYHVPQRMALQHVLTAIRHRTTVTALGDKLLPNAQRHLRSLEDIRTVFTNAADAVERTIEIADRCTFSLDELRYEYPVELAPAGETPVQYLRRLAWEGANKRYQHAVPEKVTHQLQHELSLIEELHYEAFFLTVHDLVKFARSQDILCQGRGSAANSTVCYCLGVTAVDPLETDLLFE
ncbi:MAG: PHP domain-containing protein, partial [Planctomycetes bacterium]|nr:PHP domain-containing protein [Planctomycetota bacterium]